MNKPKLVELITKASVNDLSNIFNQIFDEFDWLMQYIAETLGVKEIEQGDDEDDEEYKNRIAETPYGICSSFVKKCTPQNTNEIIQIAIKNDKVAELWDLLLGDEHIIDYDDFIDTFYKDMDGTPNFTAVQLKIVEEAIAYIREDME